MTYKMYEHAQAPDVHWDKSRRSADVWDGKFDAEEGEKWSKHTQSFYRHKDAPLSELSVTEALKPSWWQQRSEVASNPDAALARTSNKVAERANKLH